MMRKFAIALLLVIDLTYTTILGSILNPSFRYYIADPVLIKNSYIKEIKGDLLDIELVKKHLDIFNKYGHNAIVKYSTDSKINRPITIEIRKLDQGAYEQIQGVYILGYANTSETECKIAIWNNIPKEEIFRQTLYHELLHCYFYDHSPDKKDLMYYKENIVKEAIIKAYAEELEKRLK